MQNPKQVKAAVLTLTLAFVQAQSLPALKTPQTRYFCLKGLLQVTGHVCGVLLPFHAAGKPVLILIDSVEYFPQNFLIIFNIELKLLGQVDNVILASFGKGIHNHLSKHKTDYNHRTS